MERSVITVDGLAGSGKSTLAQHLAKELGFVHFNSGLLYRAVGFLVLKNKINPADEEAVVGLMAENKIELQQGEKVEISGKVVTAAELHLPEISEATSIASSLPGVRSRLLDVQRNVFPGKSLVAEGRDMGTVIFSDSPLKFFVEASTEVRVARRLKQLGFDVKQGEVGFEANEELSKKIEKEIIERDERDSKRAIAPTVAAQEAVIIDNSTLSLTEVIKTMYDIAAKKGLLPKND
jgi:cytidylate kinase